MYYITYGYFLQESCFVFGIVHKKRSGFFLFIRNFFIATNIAFSPE